MFKHIQISVLILHACRIYSIWQLVIQLVFFGTWTDPTGNEPDIRTILLLFNYSPLFYNLTVFLAYLVTEESTLKKDLGPINVELDSKF